MDNVVCMEVVDGLSGICNHTCSLGLAESSTAFDGADEVSVLSKIKVKSLIFVKNSNHKRHFL